MTVSLGVLAQTAPASQTGGEAAFPFLDALRGYVNPEALERPVVLALGGILALLGILGKADEQNLFIDPCIFRESERKRDGEGVRLASWHTGGSPLCSRREFTPLARA